MSFEDLIADIHVGSIITYKEYLLNRHERKILEAEILNASVYKIITANEKLNRAQLEEYYSTELDDEDYLALSEMNCIRLVLNLGLNSNNEINIKVVVLNKDYYNMGLQKLKVTNGVNLQSNQPVYTMFNW